MPLRMHSKSRDYVLTTDREQQAQDQAMFALKNMSVAEDLAFREKLGQLRRNDGTRPSELETEAVMNEALFIGLVAYQLPGDTRVQVSGPEQVAALDAVLTRQEKDELFVAVRANRTLTEEEEGKLGLRAPSGGASSAKAAPADAA